jgi:hypothetical protein
MAGSVASGTLCIILRNHVSQPASFNIRGERGVNVVDRSQISILSLRYKRKFPQKSVGPWPQSTEMILLYNRKPMKSKNVAEKTWFCCPLALVVQRTKIIRTTDINNVCVRVTCAEAHARIQELRICCHTKQTTYISVLNFKFYQSVILARKSVCSLIMTHNVSKHVGVTNE